MIKRYPHKAVVKIETTSEGPIPEVTTTTIELEGRYEPTSGNKSLDYSAKFYCPLIYELDVNAKILDGQKMEINGSFIGISKAWNYQTHCEIWLD
ncbi:hypothetical protein [Leeuwenhoekiella sp. MAR_2009_132]|uniref:hypothetical protein n=1 Tax=Leeuwenhoekiella sp. MAR_2009_132 TaxID=1392489 RepID=UPI00048D56D2|nr:hypothetical protein [Leeuwenhoekiella sp. MAR_2009_132]